MFDVVRYLRNVANPKLQEVHLQMYTAGKEKMPYERIDMASLFGSVQGRQLAVVIFSVLSDFFSAMDVALTAVCHGVYAGVSTKQLDLFVQQCKA